MIALVYRSRDLPGRFDLAPSVVMKDGRKVSFEVAHAYPDRLVSVDGEQFSRVDMARLDHDRISLGRSLGLAGGIALGVLVLGMFLESIGFGGT
jgi:hypothetical protein